MLSLLPMCNMRLEGDLLSWHNIDTLPIKLENGLNLIRSNLLKINEKYCTRKDLLKCLYVKWGITSQATELQKKIWEALL